MAKFKDRHGYPWTLDIDIGLASRVKKDLGINLLGLMEKEFAPMEALLNDPIDFINVLYLLCKDQADLRTVPVPSPDGIAPPTTRPFNDRDFGRCFSGDSLWEAANAFQEAYLDFFPDPAVRSTLRKMLDKGQKARNNLIKMAEKEVDETDPALLELRWREQFGNLRVSSASTPTDTSSGS